MTTRREILLALGALAALPAYSQQPGKIARVAVIGLDAQYRLEFFQQGMKQLGYVEGRNVAFEYRISDYSPEQLSRAAAEIVASKADVILSMAPRATLAMKSATRVTPIVFVGIGDPLASGLVTSLAHPGGNLTGTTRMLTEMSAKNLTLLKEAMPKLSRLAVLWNPANSSHPPALKAVEATARSLSIQLRAYELRTAEDFNGVFTSIGRDRAEGILLLTDPLFSIHLKRIVEFAASKRLPTATNWVELPEEGGLMGYATSLADEYRRAAIYVDKILKGAKPGDLPIEQPTKFEFVVNLKTAKAMGIKFPQSILLRADRVIE
jgi:putative ABC transport system substrate-binding protein